MIIRIDRGQTALPRSSDPDPLSAAAVQEFLGGKLGSETMSLRLRPGVAPKPPGLEARVRELLRKRGRDGAAAA